MSSKRSSALPAAAGTLQEVCEFFFEQERRLELVDTTPRGLPLWAAMRVKASQLLAARLGIGQAPHLVPSGASRLARLGSRLRHFVDHDPFAVPDHCDVVLLEHTRTAARESARVDVHSVDWEQRFLRSGISYRLLSAPYAPGFDKEFVPPRYSTERILALGWFEPLARGDFLPASVLSKMRELDRAAVARFGVGFAAPALAFRRYQALSGRTALYTELLERWSPRQVYLVEGYGLNVSLIAAARRLGIETSEIQHGTFGPFHLGYAYPGRTEKIPGLADRLFVWSDDWKRRVPLSPALVQVEVSEPSFLRERRERFSNVRKERLVVVLSQGLLGDRMAEAFSKVRERFNGYRIVYKLHPGEYARRASYAHLTALEREQGVEVVEDAELGELLARAESVVGVYSTTLYEALDLGCRVYLLALPGVEFSQQLVDEGRAELLSPAPTTEGR